MRPFKGVLEGFRYKEVVSLFSWGIINRASFAALGSSRKYSVYFWIILLKFCSVLLCFKCCHSQSLCFFPGWLFLKHNLDLNTCFIISQKVISY